MVQIEDYNDNDDGPYGDQYDQPGAGTQAAASVLLGFGAASGEKQLTPEQVFKQSQEKKTTLFQFFSRGYSGII